MKIRIYIHKSDNSCIHIHTGGDGAMQCYSFEPRQPISYVREHSTQAETAEERKSQYAAFLKDAKTSRAFRGLRDPRTGFSTSVDSLEGGHTFDKGPHALKHAAFLQFAQKPKSPHARQEAFSSFPKFPKDSHTPEAQRASLTFAEGLSTFEAKDSTAAFSSHAAAGAGRKLLQEPVTGVFIVSWDKDSETLRIKSNGTIPARSTIGLLSNKDDFPLT